MTVFAVIDEYFWIIVNSFYEELEKCGLLQPMQCRVEGVEQLLDTKHFIATKGMSSLVEYYLAKSGICVLMASQ